MDDAYLEQINSTLMRLERTITAMDERLRQAENREAGFSPLMTSKIDAAWRRLDENQNELTELRRDLAQLVQTVSQLQSILRWILGIVTSLFVAVLIALATGHLSLQVVP